MIAKYCMNRILPCQTKSAAEGRPGWWLVIGSGCNLNKAGAAGAGPGKDRILLLVRRAGWPIAGKQLC